MLTEKKLDKLAEQLRKHPIPNAALGDAPDYKMIDAFATVYRRDGRLIVSAEDGKGLADYYGEFRGGYPYINPDLEAWAKKHGCFWEWENPGCIMLVED